MPIQRNLKKIAQIFSTADYKFILNRIKGKNYSYTIIPTLACNLNCQMCHQSDIRKKCETEMDLEKLKQVVINLKKEGFNQVSLIGGEIFLNKKKIWDLINFFEEKRILYSLATNATMLNDEDINKLSKLKMLLEMEISIDGPSKIHNKIRGVKGSYEKAINSIKRLKSFGVTIVTVTVIQKNNLNLLNNIAKSMKDLGVDTQIFVLEYSVTQEEFLTSKNILEKISNKKVEMFMSYSVNDNCYNYAIQEFKKVISNLEKYCEKNNINLKLSFDPKQFDTIYNKTAKKEKILTCPSLSNNSIQIDWTGKLDFCPFIRITGVNGIDLTNKNQTVINKELEKIRTKVSDMNLLPICVRCCGVQVFEKKEKN